VGDREGRHARASERAKEMEQQQQQQQQLAVLLRAIAASSRPEFGGSDRQAAFRVLEEFKSYDGRMSVALAWLQSSERICYSPPTSPQQPCDVTLPTKLLALETISAFMQKGQYGKLSEPDRVALRQAVLKASRIVALSDAAAGSSGGGGGNGSRILGKKLAAVLAGLVVRDFPQRWATFADDLLSPLRRDGGGGLWVDPAVADEQQSLLGVSICLECFKLVSEDCTDSDFNVKISTQRRNDVLTGLNEVSDTFLPLFFHLLEHYYPLLQQSKATLYEMHQYLVSTGRKTSAMTPDEAAMYRNQVWRRNEYATLLSDTLGTLEKFCATMPVGWMTGEKVDFIAAMMHLLRERQSSVQIRAVECFEQLCSRGKLTFQQWMRLVRELPHAVQEANQVFVAEKEQRRAEEVATSSGFFQPKEEQPLALQLDFHRALSKMLAGVLSSHVAHINSDKRITSRDGPHYDCVRAYFRLLVDILHHPSGRICSEQINTWVALLRDPQIVRTQLVQPVIEEVMVAYMDHLVRFRWDDVENETHPLYEVLEASFDDEDEYDTWMSDLRSRSSLFFKLIGNVEPMIASRVLLSRVQFLLTNHGTGQPLNFLESSNNQLTQKSDAVLQFEGLYQPLENALSGIPPWALEPDDSKSRRDPRRMEARQATQTSLAELARELVAWNPTYLWLRFRRASLLDALKHIWKYDPSTLLQGVDSLLRYLGLPDEWNTSNASIPSQRGQMSDEIVSLKKKSGVTLVSVSKMVPHHLVPWLSQLSDATSSLLSSDGLIPLNQMHLYEFLSCIATAVKDPLARSDFISKVLSNAVETLESPETQQYFNSVPSFLAAFGVTDAQPETVANPEVVSVVTSRYNNLFSALNRLLSVGRRCNEAARKEILAEMRNPASSTVLSGSGFGSAVSQLNFPDEGPLAIQKLAENDPFVPLWPRILPLVLQIYEVILSVWRPEHQAAFLAHPVRRYLYAFSDDEAFLAKSQGEGKSGGVFGDGGTAGSVVSGVDRRAVNLVPKWSGWFNELRNTVFQFMGLLAAQRVLFAPEISSMYPRIVAVLTDQVNLRSMEHRHITQFLKHFVEILLLSCPSTMYSTHLAPLLDPICEHLRFRLENTWLPIVGGSSYTGSPEWTKALTVADSNNAALIASQGGDTWFKWYYAHAGLFVGDLEDIVAESAVEKHRIEISRAYGDVLQSCLALKGDWALVLANQAKEEQASKRNDSSKLTSGPPNRFNEDGVELNADGTPKLDGQVLIDARKFLRINGICHFLLLENEKIAGNITLSIIQCLGYPDAYTCRRAAKVCHRILETVAWSPQYSQLLGQQMFTQAVKNIVTEPKWMVGMEWDIINIIRDIYCRLVLGQVLQFGGQGPGQQQPNVAGGNADQYEQAKTADRPLQGGGVLTTASNYPRQVLSSLPGISVDAVARLEFAMKQKRSAKDQKDVLRDFLREAADNYEQLNPSPAGGGAASAVGSSIFDHAGKEESLLHTHRRAAAVPDLPEKLITRSQVEKASAQQELEPEGMAAAIFQS